MYGAALQTHYADMGIWDDTTYIKYELLVDVFDPFFVGFPVELNNRGEVLLKGYRIGRFPVEMRVDIAKAKLHGLVKIPDISEGHCDEKV